MTEPLQQRALERKIFEAIIDMIVDVATKEFKDDGEARLRIYELVSKNLEAMVRVLRSPDPTNLAGIPELITDGSAAIEEIKNG